MDLSFQFYSDDLDQTLEVVFSISAKNEVDVTIEELSAWIGNEEVNLASLSEREATAIDRYADALAADNAYQAYTNGVEAAADRYYDAANDR